MRKFTVGALIAVLALGVGTGAAIAHSQKSHSHHSKHSRLHKHGKAHRFALQQQQQQGTQTNGSKLEGTIASVNTTGRTLSVTPEDSNTPVTVDVPSQFDMSQFTQGSDVELFVTPNSDGTFTLVSVDENENAQGDDQGDQNAQGGDDQGDQQQGEQGDDDSGQQGQQGDDDSGQQQSGGDNGGDNSGSGGGSDD